MPIYNKLVRDNIPSIIKENGQKCTVEKLKSVDFIKELKSKFQEELDEFLETTNDNDATEELADILEIIHTFARIHKTNIDGLEKKRQKKFDERGGFEEQILLIEVENN